MHIVNKSLWLFLLSVQNKVVLLLPLVLVEFFISPEELRLQLLDKEVLRLAQVSRMIIFLGLEVLINEDISLKVLGDRTWI